MTRKPSALRVLMVSWEYPPYFTGGAGVACEGMVRALLRRGTEVSLLLPWAGDSFTLGQNGDFPVVPDEDGSSVPAGVVGRACSSVPAGDTRAGLAPWTGVYTEQTISPSSVPAVPDIKYPCDLIHCHDWPTVPVAVELKNRLDVPLVFHLHSLESDRSPAGRCREIEGLERLGCRKADLVITVSKYTAGNIISEYGVSPEKVRVFYNGYTLGGIPRPERGQRHGYKRVLFLGRFVPQKGVDIFLEAALTLARARHDVRFVMVGTGPMAGELRERAGGFVRFPGFLPRQEIAGLLEETDILVMPSRSEPFGIAALEAMSRGCTVVINRTAGLTEIAKNLVALEGENSAELVRLLSGLLDNSEGMKALGRAAAAEAAGLGWEMRITDLLSLYDELF